MPETTPKVDGPSGTFRSIITLWHNIHFSGKVIMCSVLFGLGIILIGSLIFVININDSGTSYENPSDNVPTKPPNNVVGPVVMGIGAFIVIVGIIMCLFETQICRKRSGDSSPLISNGATNSRTTTEPAAVPSTSYAPRHSNCKATASSKRSKNHNAKSYSKKNQKIPRTPPIIVETSKGFMTSSEENFLTPPNTFGTHTVLIHSNSRDAENQTSSSLMKSFNISGQSWNQSTEFETPATSFRDTSVSLDNSIEVDKNEEQGNNSINSLIESNINAGFLTPINLEKENLQEISTNIESHKKELHDTQSKEKSEIYLSNDGKYQLSDVNTKYEMNLEHINVKPNEYDEKHEQNLYTDSKNDSTEPKSVANNISTKLEGNKPDSEFINYEIMSQQNEKDNSLEKIIDEERDKIDISDKTIVDNQLMKHEDDDKVTFSSTDDSSNSICEINKNEKHNIAPFEECVKADSSKHDEDVYLANSASSNKTIVSQETTLEKNAVCNVSIESTLELKENMTKEIAVVGIVESTNETDLSRDLNCPNIQSSIKATKGEQPDANFQIVDKKITEASEELMKDICS